MHKQKPAVGCDGGLWYQRQASSFTR